LLKNEANEEKPKGMPNTLIPSKGMLNKTMGAKSMGKSNGDKVTHL
jgi:hypothetical protein